MIPTNTNTESDIADDHSSVILIQGDSIPLPRKEVNYTDTWIYKLRTQLESKHVVALAQSEKTTRDLHPENQAHRKRELENYKPSTIIIQLGIVDCAPRYFSWPEIQIVRTFPSDFLSQMTRHVAVRLRTRSGHRAYTSEREFKSNIENYFERAERIGVNRIFIIEILPASRKYLDKNPNVDEAICTYNQLIREAVSNFELAEAVKPLDVGDKPSKKIVDKYTLSDGYHLNRSGHDAVFENVVQQFE